MTSPLHRYRDQGRVCEITTPQTPAPWFNHLFNRDYIAFVSQTGQGESGCLAPFRSATNRKTRHFYLRDRQSGVVHATTCAPLGAKPDSFLCEHTPASTRITTSWDGLEVGHRFFVPLSGQREYITLSVANRGERPRQVSLYAYQPLVVMEGGFGTTGEYLPDLNTIVCREHPYYAAMGQYDRAMLQRKVISTLASEVPASWDTSQKSFYGPGGGEHLPLSIAAGGDLARRRGSSEICGAAWEWRLDLAPGESRVVHLAMLAHDFNADLPAALAAFRAEFDRPGHVEEELRRCEAWWSRRLEADWIETPDAGYDAGANIWVKKQLYLMALTHRASPNPCSRNEIQDLEGLSLFADEHAHVADALAFVLSFQRRDGYLLRSIAINDLNPITGLGLLDFKDGHVWLPMAVATYVKQSGDLAFLDREVPYRDGGSGSVREHLRQAFVYVRDHCGAHDLPLLGEGDWDDPLGGPGEGGKGESTWIAQAVGYAIRGYLPVAEAAGDADTVALMRELRDRFRRAVDTHCWNGEWYVRGFDDHGVSFGDRHCEEGRGFLNAQSWAILGDMASPARAAEIGRLLDTVYASPHGPVTIDRPFTRIDRRIGKITVKPAGHSENGSVYCHAAMFKAMADTLAGRGDACHDTLTLLWAGCGRIDPWVSEQSPTFIPNFYIGPAAGNQVGRSSHYWSTGSAAWFMRIVLEHVCGLRAELDGVLVDPCLPSAWPSASCRRRLRGATYELHIRKTDTAVPVLRADGVPLPWSKPIPYAAAGANVRLDVELPAS